MFMRSHAQKVVAAAQRLMDADEAGIRRPAPPPYYHGPVPVAAALSSLLIATRRLDPDNWTQEQKEQKDSLSIAKFEHDRWQEYGLTGDFDPETLLKECQRRVREAEKRGNKELQESTMSVLDALDMIHKMRKQLSYSFAHASGQEGIRRNVGEATQNDIDQLKAVGRRFWAVLIGNDKYSTGKQLHGCINDTYLIRDYLLDHLDVPNDHIRLLHNAPREAIINALYDLRDNMSIQFGDNILVHFSGHGASYDAKVFFSTGVSSVGPIEAICPSDRTINRDIPDISDRELNLILSEVRDAKGENITFIADCCYSGGMVRANSIVDEESTRGVAALPAAGAHNKHSVSPPPKIHTLLKVAEMHPRRKSLVLASSMNWEGDVSAFVDLAACQDFQEAREVTRNGRKYGAFTWALVKVLRSAQSHGQTYTGIIRMIGRLNDQVPKVIGDRKESRLWFQTSPTPVTDAI